MVLRKWGIICLLCGNHGEDYSNEMTLREGKEGMAPFWACPKYVSIYSGQGGHSCNNRLYYNDFEKMLNKVTNEKFTDDGDEVSVIGLKWKEKNVEYKVIGEKDGKVQVVATNHRVIGK